jgi:hypothetical protein
MRGRGSDRGARQGSEGAARGHREVGAILSWSSHPGADGMAPAGPRSRCATSSYGFETQ